MCSEERHVHGGRRLLQQQLQAERTVRLTRNLLLVLLLGACDSTVEGEQECVPYASGFGGVCASFLKCPEDAPICATANHSETFGYCTRQCEDLFGCRTDAGITKCDVEVVDVPGVDGGVRACAFDCSGCPVGFECRDELSICIPEQRSPSVDASVRCEPPDV